MICLLNNGLIIERKLFNFKVYWKIVRISKYYKAIGDKSTFIMLQGSGLKSRDENGISIMVAKRGKSPYQGGKGRAPWKWLLKGSREQVWQHTPVSQESEDSNGKVPRVRWFKCTACIDSCHIHELEDKCWQIAAPLRQPAGQCKSYPRAMVTLQI